MTTNRGAGRLVRGVRQGVAACALGVLLLGGGVATTVTLSAAQAQPATPAPAQPGPGAAQDEYVPIDQLPPEEKLPAGRFLVAAYSIVWIGMTFYVWTVWRRLARVEQELTRVAARKP